ncbi:MAG: ketopantoate reductase family protein [Gammaproteobacteria bacterium]|nr:ketopantoate reductase family protein [Gammaproteobacteria bacterium]
MHFVIMGAGALGILLAAHLSRAGHTVQLVARGARARALAEAGLEVRGLATFRARCTVLDDPSSPGETDVFINTVKTHDSAQALASLTRLQPRVAFSVQNGVVKEAELIERFGAAAVLGAMADFSGELEDDDAVLFTRNINLHLGELDGAPSARATEIATAIHDAGINARVATDIQSVIWSKFTGWVALFLMSVLTRRYTGQYLSDPDVALVVARIVRETALLPQSLGIPLQDISPMPVLGITSDTEAEAVTRVVGVGERMHANAPLHRLSALQDLLRGKRLELDQTVGYACREGARLGLAQPVLNTCHGIAAGINHGLG